jgi:TRAP-type C4-dicarboxylate transport system permease large subunit
LHGLLSPCAKSANSPSLGIQALVRPQRILKRLDKKIAVSQSVANAGAILPVIGATAMAWALKQSGFSALLTEWMQALPGGTAGFMLFSTLAIVVLRSFLEGSPLRAAAFPIAKAVGVHEVHFAMVAAFAMGLGLFGPPLEVGCYAACGIGKVNPHLAMRRLWPYLGTLVAALGSVQFTYGTCARKGDMRRRARRHFATPRRPA